MIPESLLVKFERGRGCGEGSLDSGKRRGERATEAKSVGNAPLRPLSAIQALCHDSDNTVQFNYGDNTVK
jgi:hypothetical protein